MVPPPVSDLIGQARQRLDAAWRGVPGAADGPREAVPADVAGAVRRSVNSPTKTYRYVLPTQLLGKLTDPALDCRCVQASSGLAGAFDARSLCHGVIVPFDRANGSVLGGSPEPYANNPLRIPALVREHRAAQKNKAGFDDLVAVLEFAQRCPEAVPALFGCLLGAVRDRLERIAVTYPVPNRVSLRQTRQALATFLDQRTGGLRLQAVAVALFRRLGEALALFADVRSADVNAADASTGSVADLECLDGSGAVLLAVEVKDRTLTLRHAQDKLPGIRQKGIRELLFLVHGGVDAQERQAVDQLLEREFTTGQNLYVCEFGHFLEACLVLFGERGRREFLAQVGRELDARRADHAHRAAWAAILQAL